MKKMNKFVSMLLVVAMIFAMSISAFAAIPASGSINATVVFEMDDDPDFVLEVPVTMTSANSTIYYDIPTLALSEYYNSDIVMNDDRPSVMDATLAAVSQMMGENTTLSGWDRKYHGDTLRTEILGGYLDSIFGYETETTDYLVPTENYSGYWKGNAWLYKVVDANGNVVVDPGPTFVDGVYATNLVLQEGMTITWTYTHNIVATIPYEG